MASNITDGKSSESSHNKSSEKVEGRPFPVGMLVLLVDNDPVCLMMMAKMLRQCHYKVTTCTSAAKALEVLRKTGPAYDLVMSDANMPDMDGFKLLETIHNELQFDLPVVLMSTDGETEAIERGNALGACDYLLKPIQMDAVKVIWRHVKVIWRPGMIAFVRTEDHK